MRALFVWPAAQLEAVPVSQLQSRCNVSLTQDVQNIRADKGIKAAVIQHAAGVLGVPRRLPDLRSAACMHMCEMVSIWNGAPRKLFVIIFGIRAFSTPPLSCLLSILTYATTS